MKVITESEFNDAVKIVDAYFDQVNEKIKKAKSKGMIIGTDHLERNRETHLTELPFINTRLLNGLKVKVNPNNYQNFNIGWLESMLENVSIKTFCDESRNLGPKSGSELSELCDRIGINYIY